MSVVKHSKCELLLLISSGLQWWSTSINSMCWTSRPSHPPVYTHIHPPIEGSTMRGKRAAYPRHTARSTSWVTASPAKPSPPFSQPTDSCKEPEKIHWKGKGVGKMCGSVWVMYSCCYSPGFLMNAHKRRRTAPPWHASHPHATASPYPFSNTPARSDGGGGGGARFLGRK